MKLCTTVLSLILLCGIAVTSQAQVAKPGPLRVGAAKIDITPAQSELPKQYLGVLDRVYSRAIVIENGTTSAALITVDVISLSDAISKRVNDRIAAELGIPANNIVLAGTGTHSSPIGSGPQGPGAPASPNASFEDKMHMPRQRPVF